MIKALWSISDLLILIGLFYGPILLIKVVAPLMNLKVLGIIIGTITVNIAAPFVAAYFKTPLYELMETTSLSYYQPISILTAVITILAIALNAGKLQGDD